jgi:hypothetical protein
VIYEDKLKGVTVNLRLIVAARIDSAKIVWKAAQDIGTMRACY